MNLKTSNEAQGFSFFYNRVFFPIGSDRYLCIFVLEASHFV